MTDWSKYKVADLKEECKSREIPLTGLKLKQQYIDKLQQYEAQQPNPADRDEKNLEVEPVEEQHAQENGEDPEPIEAEASRNENEEELKPAQDVEVDEATDQHDATEANVPGTLLEEEKHAVQDPEDAKKPTLEAPVPADDVGVRNALFVQEREDLAEKTAESKQEASEETGQYAHEDSTTEVQQQDDLPAEAAPTASSQKPTLSPTPQPTQNQSDSNTPRTSQIPPSDLAEDRKNRLKRSATPVPSAQDISRKRLRLSPDAQEAKAEEALEQKKAATESTREIRMENTDAEPAEPPVKEDKNGDADTEPPVEDNIPTKAEPNEETPSRSLSRSVSPAEDRNITPAIHPATSSLYISRLKRPIQPQLFRSHIISKAKSRSSGDADPITAFYLDSIKTHAFVSFTSVTAASRVRSAMHEVRYPEEASREPLFVDFVPDDKVQSWIDQETESGFGRVSGGRKVFEVIYEETDNGVEAVFQEAGSTNRRPPVEPSLSSRMSFDRKQPVAVAAGVHPDRAAFVPRVDQNRDRVYPRAPPTGPKNSSSDAGKGFKALDELFSSTTAKPKLYYKPVSASVADERLDMFRDLRVGHDQMGRSGQEGMKRYSFERTRDGEEWVDKGPEFGHGRRGQERLVGGDRGGRGRGRGGGYRGRPMDSWRGSGR